MYFPEYLVSMLKRHNLTQSKLAELMDVDASLVSYWCSGGRHPNKETIPQIIKLFALTTEEEKEHLHKIYFKQENK